MLHSIYWFWTVIILLAVLTRGTIAQQSGGSPSSGGGLRIHVTTTDNQPADPGLLVRLIGDGGEAIAQGYTDHAGEVAFDAVPPGTYRAVVSGEGYERSDRQGVKVDREPRAQTVLVRVRGDCDDGDVVLTSTRETMADPSMLRAPKKAMDELRRGNEQLEQKQWTKAAEHLRKAVEIDKEFGAAYNNLAVAYAKLGDPAHEREALDEALKWSDHNQAALMNRAHLALVDNDVVAAEEYLLRAEAIDPTNPQVLMVLATVQLRSKHYDDVLLSTQRMHHLPHQQYALVHYLAARAYEAKDQLPAAASELSVFLQEDPRGEWSDAARKELGLLDVGRSLLPKRGLR